jgi:hypothetical protein
MRKRKFFRFAVAGVCLTTAYVTSWAQSPASVVPEAATFYKDSTDAGGKKAAEYIDSVTVGSTTKYYVLPDPVANPSFVYGTSLWNNVVSTFGWTVPVGLSAAGAVATAFRPLVQHYKQIAWTGTGSGNIQVVETGSTGCAGSTLITAVAVVPVPDVTAISIANITCSAQPISVACNNANLTISCAEVGHKAISVNYTLSGPAGFTTVTNTVGIGDVASVTLSGITLNKVGTYTFTINTITDRIAVKSGLAPTADGTFTTFVVTPTPVTGPMYHVPNQ